MDDRYLHRHIVTGASASMIWSRRQLRNGEAIVTVVRGIVPEVGTGT